LDEAEFAADERQRAKQLVRQSPRLFEKSLKSPQNTAFPDSPQLDRAYSLGKCCQSMRQPLFAMLEQAQH